jgi:hypothetical protein
MKIEPIASNKIYLTSNNGICISVSDDGDNISIKREIDFNHAGSEIIKGVFYTYKEYHEENTDHKIIVDVVRIDK